MGKRKHDVEVLLVTRRRVRLTVDVEDGDSPTDLTEAELDRAAEFANMNDTHEWDVESVREVPQ